MKVGVFLGNWDAQSGGASTFEATLLEALEANKSSHEFYVFYFGDKMENSSSLKFVALPKKNNLFDRAANKFLQVTQKEFNKKLQEYHIEFIWFMTPSFIDVDIPYIYTVWDLQHRMHPFFPEVSVTGWTWHRRETHYKSVLPRAAYIITGTEIGRNEIMNFYNIRKDRIKILPFPTPSFASKKNPQPVKYNPFDKADGTFIANLSSKSELPSNYLFYPAQFWPHKNHIALLHALKILNDDYNLNFSLVLTGSDKGNLDYIKQKAEEMKIHDKIIFSGFVLREELVKLYKNAFALIYPTFFGPDNLPPLEAFALGCPVIASRVDGSEEQLGDAAILFDPCNEKEMASAVKRLYDDQDLRQNLIKQGFERSQKWTALDYIDGIIGIVDDFSNYRRCWSSQELYKHT